MATLTYSTPGTYYWLCPAGVYVLSKVAVWGGAGGGCNAVTAGGGGGAGSGGYSAEVNVLVTPGVLYTIVVGVRGGNGNPGANGGDSWATFDTVTVYAYGGGGAPAGSGAGGAAGPASSNTTAYPGAAGGTGWPGSSGPGGGGASSAGPGGPGNPGGNATATLAGAGGAAVTGGGAGGNGSNTAGQAQAGGSPGGGGGGGGNGAGKGNAGGYGQVQLTYASPAPFLTPSFTAGYAPGPQDFANWVQQPFASLTSKVVFRAELSSALTWVANANTLIPFNVIDEDPFAGWSSGSSSWMPPAGYSGTYLVTLTVSSGASADNLSTLHPVLYLNGSSLYTLGEGQASTGAPTVANGSAPVQLYGGQDQLSFYGWWASTGNGAAVTTAGQRCTAEVSWVAL